MVGRMAPMAATLKVSLGAAQATLSGGMVLSKAESWGITRGWEVIARSQSSAFKNPDREAAAVPELDLSAPH